MKGAVSANVISDISIDYSSISGSILNGFLIGVSASYSPSEISKIIPIVSSTSSRLDKVRFLSTVNQTINVYVCVIYK